MKYIILISALFLFGCDTGSENRNNSFINKLHYVKDSYGICYAIYGADTNYGLLTTVPCEKVGL